MMEGDSRHEPGSPQGVLPDHLTSDNRVFQHLEDLAAGYGFDCFALMTLPASNHERIDDNLLASSFQPDFIRKYEMFRPFRTAPMFARLRTSTAPFAWRLDDAATRPTDGAPEADQLFSLQLLTSGVVVPLHTPEGIRATAIYAGGREPLPDAEFAALTLSTVVAYDALCQLRQEPQPPMAKLSDREIQVLGWAANGKTSVEIATILSLSDHTVNSYLNSAMRKMDCVNRTQLVAKALRLRLIS